MKYFEIIDKNVAAIFQLQWKIGNISDNICLSQSEYKKNFNFLI